MLYKMYKLNTNDGFRSWLEAGYPRPELCREDWLNLGGPWEFAEDPEDIGVNDRWFSPAHSLQERIVVPFPAGSPLSEWTPADPSRPAADVLWYRRRVTATELEQVGQTSHLQLNFEAVDFIADVWINGDHLGHHRGGYTPFSVVTTRPTDGTDLVITVRTEDHLTDTSQPRGKQDWRPSPHGIWYEQSSGIWRDVWMEAVPQTFIDQVRWDSDIDLGTVTATIDLSRLPRAPVTLEVLLGPAEAPLAFGTTSASDKSTELTMKISVLANRHEWDSVLWSPSHPNLWDARIHLKDFEGNLIDSAVSYFGIRKVSVDPRYLLINRMPCFLRGVLDQGYWPQSYFTAPSADALRAEVDLISNLGFNMARVHERTADRRYLAWADVRGLMVWAESASAIRFDYSAIENTLSEWLEAVRRDYSHPSVIAWVPFNESWGVSSLAQVPQQRALVDATVSLTRALDRQNRPVIANDGWEQLDTDIVSTHDYAMTGEELFANYRSEEAVTRTLAGVGPQGRQTLLRQSWKDERPVMVTEFGGVTLSDNDLADSGSETWGYGVAQTIEDLRSILQELFKSLYSSPVLGGICYTQLTDTGQETNGLCRADRTPKLPTEQIREIVTNLSPHHQHIRPRLIEETKAHQCHPSPSGNTQ